MILEVGMKAPLFTLPDKDGNLVRLSDFLGKKVVLYFYPKDNTPGCTRQACAFGESYRAFQAKNTVVIGISKDSAASHQKFAAKYNLPFSSVGPGFAGDSVLQRVAEKSSTGNLSNLCEKRK